MSDITGRAMENSDCRGSDEGVARSLRWIVVVVLVVVVVVTMVK
jgi:hypothetical protein